MRRLTLSLTLLTLTTLACEALADAGFPRLPAPKPAPTSIEIPSSEEDVPRISASEAKNAFDNDKALIVDVRSVDAFQESHITGALSIPLEEIEYGLIPPALKKDKWIITYCTWEDEYSSARAAFILLQLGYQKVTPILGGLEAWIEEGFPIKLESMQNTFRPFTRG